MKNGRILVVDDQVIQRKMIQRILVKEDFEVTLASSGEEALKLFEDDPFPLVLTDIRMGGMSGLDLIKALNEMDPDLVSIVMTAQKSFETATQALRSGAYDYLTKPFSDTDHILRIIHRARERRKLTDENRLLVEQLKISAAEMQTLNRRLMEAATRDGLTGLYNHRFFWEALEKEVSRARRHKRSFSVVMMDVDHFKSYNDANGHPIGDLGLKMVAEVLQDVSRSSDLEARYGGEEFAILAPETNADQALVLAEKLRAAVEQTTFPGASSQPLGRVTISCGVASFPKDGDTGSEILEHADAALYEAKHTGRNRVAAWGRFEKTGS